MTPLILYTLFAGLLGVSVHKKWHGGVAFSVALLIWMLLIQCICAYATHPTLN